MESNRVRADLAKERRRRKTAAAKEATRRSSAVRRTGGGTVVTERTTSTISDELTTLGFDRDEELALPLPGEPKKQKHARHRSLSSSRGRDFTRPRSPERESPRKHLKEDARQSDSFHSTLRQSATGIARQHESIITLDPTGRYSSAGTCHTPKSVSSLTSFEETIDNRYRMEQGNAVLPDRRGRSRSKSRTRSRSASRPRAELQQTHRSKSRGRPSRGRSKNDRSRAGSKPRSQSTGTAKPPRARRTDIEHQARVVSMSKSKREKLTRTAAVPAVDSGNDFDAPISPLSNQSPSGQAEIPFVTSYFDI